MPEKCKTDWEIFHIELSMKGPMKVTEERSLKVFEVAVNLADMMPNENLGIPIPPSDELCGPNRDGTWPKRGSEEAKKNGVTKTILS